MPTLVVDSKGPRSFQLRGPFALPGLRHDISILANKDCFESMSDGDLARGEEAAINGFVDRSADFPRKPNIGFPVPPLAAGLTETLSPLPTRCISHFVHP
jgi:hypothetical protein